MITRRAVPPAHGRLPSEVAAAVRTLYVLWGALGLSILILFGVLLALQRQGVVEIGSGIEPGASTGHVAAAAALFAVGVAALGMLRARLRNPDRLAGGSPGQLRARPGASTGSGADSPQRRALSRVLSLSVAGWTLAEGLALVGFTAALALPPVPRLALTIYFTGALCLWLWGRPSPEALLAAWRRAGASP